VCVCVHVCVHVCANENKSIIVLIASIGYVSMHVCMRVACV